ncbi:hypothetical protein LWI28_000385 [Acer negundo]|uniref:Cyclin-D1-binding protein 1 n=1 Tax=Acer negundo TaxID=4023 RepID=A0AAD5IKX4_ACENE|nr:hypothetical protein LWI28_000385 [Acer negundo]KAK4842702.1 hypothetical protein QYF36_026370 [Acer negundo]
MGRTQREKERLTRVLNEHLNTIHETLQLLDQTPASSLEKVSWDEVIKMGDQVSKQATIVGMLWTGGTPEAKQIEENMAAYFNVLQGFILLSHGSTVDTGPTLSSSIHVSVKQVVDSSFKLMMESVSLYGSHNKAQQLSMPQIVGTVWDACSALKKVAPTNITAIGRAMTQVAFSVRDVLREMKELKPASCDPMSESSDDASTKADSEAQKDDEISMDDLGNDLSPEEMKIAHSAIEIVSESLQVLKELIRTISGAVKLENPDDKGKFVDSLEKLLKLSKGIGLQIDELGACLYPPHEVSAIKEVSEKLSSIIAELQKEAESFYDSPEALIQACIGLKSLLKRMESELDCSSVNELEAKLQNVSVSN